MAVDNNSNNAKESVEKNKNVNQEDLKRKFLKEFAWKYNTPEIVSSVMKNDTIDEDLKKKLEGLKEKENKDYGNLILNNINTSDGVNIQALKVAYAGNSLKLNTARNLFFSEVKKKFVIGNEEEKSLEKIIEVQTVDNLYNYINSPLKLEKLLKDRIKNIQKLEAKNLFLDIKGIDVKKVEERIKEKYPDNPDKLTEVRFIFSKIVSYSFNDSDIRGLFEFDILDFEGKKNLIDAYIPVISLGRAIEIGLIDRQGADEKKKILLSKYRDKNIDDATFEKILSYASYDDIILKSKDLYNKDNINLLADNVGFENLEQDFKILKENALSEIKLKGPQTFDSLMILLAEINSNNRFKDLEKFKKGNIIKYTTKDSDNKLITTYVEISSIDDKNNEFGYKVIGEGSHISLENSKKTEEKKSYVDFLEGLKQKSDVKFECFTHDNIEKQVKDGELIQNEFNNVSLDNLSIEEKTKLTDKYIGGLEQEISLLEQEIKDTQDEKIKKEKEKLLEQKQNNLNLYRNYDEEPSNVINKLRLIEKLDEIDPDGRNIGFGKGILFQIEDDVYEIVGFEDVIKLKNTVLNKEQTIVLEDFFTTFKEKKAKRIEKIEKFSTLIEKSMFENKSWDNHEVKDGELIAKGIESGGKTGEKVVDYLVGDKTNDLIKINNINGDHVKIQFGERKGYSDLSDDEKKKNKIKEKSKGEMVYLEDKEYTISLNDLDNLIKEKNLYPNWKTGKTIEPEKIKDIQNKIGGSFVSRYFRRTSINELLAGGKMLVDGIKETLKKGNGLHAAEFAMRIGKILPGDLGADMQIMVERAQEEQQSKELESLGKVDSPIAVKRIRKWLENKDTQEYKKEAGILFMLDKYGHLSAKGAMYEFRGKRLWYEALGGKINDKLFIEKKAEAEASNITFSEEYLIHHLLKKQCNSESEYYPKRRSRLHKEFENKWKSGVAAEFDKGYADGDKKRTARDIAEGGHGEADTGTTSNAIGWYKKAVERGGSLEEMSEGFFALLFSGALYNVDQATFLKIKGLWDGDGMPIIMTRFSTSISDMKLFNNTVLEVCKSIKERKYPEHEGIYEEALKLFNEALSGKGSEGDRFKKTVSFWKKHGTPIARALNMANVADNKYSKTDKIIFLEKDTNKVFKNYYERVRIYTSMDSPFAKGFMDDECGEVGLTGLNINKLTKKYLKLGNNRKFYDTMTGGRVWHEISTDIISTKNKRFDTKDDLDREKKEKYLVYVLRELISGFFDNMGGDTIKSYNDPTSETGKYFNSWKLNIYEDLGKFSSSDIAGSSKDPKVNEKIDSILLRTAKNILDGGGSDYTLLIDPLEELKSGTKKNTDNAINNGFLI